MSDGSRAENAKPLPRRMAWPFVVAVGVAALLGLLAPSEWDRGPGRVVLEIEGAVLVDEPVEVGSGSALDFSGGIGRQAASLLFPEGVPVDRAVEAFITFEVDGAVVEPALSKVTLAVRLADGTVEPIPVIRWDEDRQRLAALRRPPQDTDVVVALLGLVVVLWVTEAVPLFVTSLLVPVVLVFSGAFGATEALAPFFNPIIVLFFAGFLMAEAMHRTRLDHWVAVSITAGAGRSPKVLFLAMLALTAFLSMWMSNTAATAVLVPIALAVTEPLQAQSYRRVLVLGIAYSATIGGVGSAIGTPANQLAIEFLGEFADRSISFIEWFAFGVPMVVVFLPLMALYLWRRQTVPVDPGRFAEARQIAKAERESLGRPGREQLVVLAVFGLVMVGWLTQTFHGIHPGIVALAGALGLFVLRLLLPADLGAISWESLLTFGGGLTLGLALVSSGTSDYVATRIAGLAGLPTVVAVLAIALATLVLTTVASNTASAAILIPLAIPLAGVLGVDPTAMVVVVAIASSIDFALVIGTPPTMIAYATRLYTARQIFRTGILLDVVGIVVLVFVVTRLWEVLGLV